MADIQASIYMHMNMDPLHILKANENRVLGGAVARALLEVV